MMSYPTTPLSFPSHHSRSLSFDAGGNCTTMAKIGHCVSYLFASLKSALHLAFAKGEDITFVDQGNGVKPNHLANSAGCTR